MYYNSRQLENYTIRSGMIAVSILSAIICWFLLKLFIYKIPIFSLATPDHRSSHKTPIPTGGGIVFVLITSVSICMCTNSWVPIVCLPLGIIGLLDDIFILHAGFRYIIQLITAFFLVKLSPLLNFQTIVDNSFTRILLYLIIIIFITALVNFSNFIDGLDGLLTGCMIVILSFTAIIVDNCIWPLVGSLIGFLFFNWSPAKVFMGDAGSTFLGAVFSGYLFQSNDWSEVFAILLIASPIILDPGICVIRRFLDGQRIFKPHLKHLFQRLNQSGWSHRRVCNLYILCILISGIIYLIFGIYALSIFVILQSLYGVWLDQKIAIGFTAN